MRFFILIVSCFVIQLSVAQNKLSGTWQGVLMRSGISIDKGTLFYVNFEATGNKLSGLTREEVYDTKFYSTKKINGTIDDSKITFDQFVEVKSKKSSQLKWCRLKGELSYDETTGYLKGNFTSTDCKRVIGTIILYRSEFTLSSEESLDVSHMWFDRFVKDYNAGLSAPDIRKIERDNFKFIPIYFDYDKAEIRPEHYDFLNRMIKIVKGHSDLRVKVTGNTDSDGSDAYNDDLSKRRAEAIIQYFVERGISSDRLEINFNGEKKPIDTNETPEGKQKNRRVEFEFI